MTTSITIKDETAAGKILNQIMIEVESEIISVKELIQLRVEQEVIKHNQTKAAYFNGLVQPKEAEATLNGYRLKNRQLIDAEKQTYIALKAFQENSFFVLVDQQQVEGLNQEIHLDKDTQVSFIKLTPLVGG